MKTFAQYLNEVSQETATFTFGRFQPPHAGHGTFLSNLKDLAKGSKVFVFTSQTKNKDNPLDYANKVRFLKASFPELASSIIENNSLKTIIDCVKFLEKKGYKNIRLGVGSDRVESFEKLLNDYNGKDYKFDVIEVVSAMERDEDGPSATKMREAAKSDDFSVFSKGISKRLSLDEKKELFELVKEGLKK